MFTNLLTKQILWWMGSSSVKQSEDDSECNNKLPQNADAWKLGPPQPGHIRTLTAKVTFTLLLHLENGHLPSIPTAVGHLLLGIK